MPRALRSLANQMDRISKLVWMKGGRHGEREMQMEGEREFDDEEEEGRGEREQATEGRRE